MKKVLGIIVIVITCILLAGEIVYNSVWALADQKGIKTITINEACLIGEVKHTVNFIPVGKDYYYLGVNDQTGEAYVILASKHWCEDNFDEECNSLDPDGYQLNCRVKKISDSKTRNNITNYLNTNYGNIGVTYPEGTERCLNETYRRFALLKLVELISLVLTVILGISVSRNAGTPTTFVKVLLAVSACVFVCLMVYTLLRM